MQSSRRLLNPQQRGSPILWTPCIAALALLVLAGAAAATFTTRSSADISQPDDALVLQLSLDTCALSNLDVTLDSPDDKTYITGTHTVQWNTSGLATDTDAGIWYYNKGDGWHEVAEKIADDGSHDWDTTATADGETWTYVWVRDTVSDCYQYAWNDYSYRVDNTAPSALDVTEPTSSTVWTGTETIAWDRTEANPDVAKVEVSTDGGSSWSTIDASATDDGSYDWDTTGYADSDQVALRLTVTDKVGLSTQVTSDTFSLDHDAPSTSVDAPASGDVVGGDVALGWTTTDDHPDVAEVEVSSDSGSSWSTVATSATDDGTLTWDSSGYDDGDSYEIRVTPTDAAGNLGSAAVGDTFTLDNTAPVVDAEDLSGSVVGGDLTIDWSTTEAHPDHVDITYSGDASGTVASGTADDGTYTWDTTTVDDGDYEMTIDATDVVGNLGSDVTGTFTVDNIAPVPSMVAPSGGDIVGGDVTVEWDLEATDLDSVVAEYSTDGGSSWTQFDSGLTGTESTTWTVSGIGDHDDCKVRIVATDGGGSTGTAATDAFTCDDTLPQLDLDRPEDGAVLGDSAEIAWTATDAHAVTTDLRISRIGEDGWTTIAADRSADGTYTWDTTSHLDGDYVLRAVAEDAAGLSVVEEIDVTVNHSLPVVEIVEPVPDAELSSPPATVSGTAADPEHAIEEVEVRLVAPDGSHWDAAAGSWSDDIVWNDADGHEDWTLDVAPDGFGDGTYRVAARVENHGGQTAKDAISFVISGEDDTDEEPTEAGRHRRVDRARVPAAALIQPGRLRSCASVRVAGAADPCLPIADPVEQLRNDLAYAMQPPLCVGACVPGLTMTRTSTGPADAPADDPKGVACGPEAVCETVDGPPVSPSTACRGVGPGTVGTSAQATAETGDSKTSVETQPVCGVAAGVLANICQAGSGARRAASSVQFRQDETAREAERACEETIGPLADLGAEWFDAECKRDGASWREAELRGLAGSRRHSAAADVAAGPLRKVEVDWSGWENHVLVCHQPDDRLPADVPSPRDRFRDADVCTDASFKIRTKGRFSGAEKPIDSARLRFVVPPDCLRETGAPTLFHYRTDVDEAWQHGWEALDAERVRSTLDGGAEFVATTESLSPFVFGYRSLGGDAGPEAAFDASCTGRTCTFDATPSLDPDGVVVSYDWTVGDAARTGRLLTHEFDEPGRYEVALTVRDDDGYADTEVRTVEATPGNEGPQASFTYRCSGGRCLLDASGSSDADGAIVAYEWELGDGHRADGEAAEHRFDADGTYRVVLTVRDEDGATGVETQLVDVSGTGVEPDNGPDTDDDGVRATSDQPIWEDALDLVRDLLASLGRVGTGLLAVALAAVAGLVVWARRRTQTADG